MFFSAHTAVCNNYQISLIAALWRTSAMHSTVRYMHYLYRPAGICNLLLPRKCVSILYAVLWCSCIRFL